MPPIIAQCFCWNSAQFIAMPILAIHKYVNEIQVFDGAYKWMKKAGYAKVPWSIDGTEQVVKGLKLACPLKWIPCTQFYTQKIKRTMMVKHWRKEKGDAWRYLMADDELPVGNVAKAFQRIRREKHASDGFVSVIEVMGRQLRKPPVSDRKRFVRLAKGGRIKLKKMFIVHLKWLRERERLMAQLDYEISKGKRYSSRANRKFIMKTLNKLKKQGS